MDNLSGRKLADIIPSLNVGVDDSLTPVPAAVRQPARPRAVLRKRAEEVGAQVRAGCELAGFSQDADGVTATVRDIDGGAESEHSLPAIWSAPTARTARCARLSASRSTAAASSRTASRSTSAPTSGRSSAASRSASIYINNPMFGGFFRLAQGLPVRLPRREHRRRSEGRSGSAQPNAAADTSEQRLIETRAHRRRRSRPAVKIDGVAALARDVGRGAELPARARLPGRRRRAPDAAQRRLRRQHRHPRRPQPRLEAGAGAQGRGRARGCSTATRRSAGRWPSSPSSRPTRATSRAPRTYLGDTDFQPLAHDFNIELGYLYRSSAIVPGRRRCARGTTIRALAWPARLARAPSLARARRKTDFDPRPVWPQLRAARGPDGDAWCDAGRVEAGRLSGLQLDIYRVGSADLADPENRFCGTYGLFATRRLPGSARWLCRLASKSDRARSIGKPGEGAARAVRSAVDYFCKIRCSSSISAPGAVTFGLWLASNS